MTITSKLLTASAGAALLALAAAPASACPMYNKMQSADMPKYMAEAKKDASDNMSVAPTEQAEVKTEVQGVPTSGKLETETDAKAE